MYGASRRCCPGSVFLQRKPAGCCEEAKKWWAATVLPRVLRFKRPLHHFDACSPKKELVLAAGFAPALATLSTSCLCCWTTRAIGLKWSQSPVLPWARLAYETCLSSGSTAMLLHPFKSGLAVPREVFGPTTLHRSSASRV